MEPTQLEEEYKKLLEAAYQQLRYNVEDGLVSREEGGELHALLQERLGVSDPNPDELPWERSTWCGDDGGWNNSGCSF